MKHSIDTQILDGIIIGRVDPNIYAFTTETIPNYLKVGDTYRSVEVRLDEWRKHFPKLKRIYNHTAKTDDNRIFRDYSVHQFLETDRKRKRLIKGQFPKQYFSNEFFEEATKKDVEDAITDICRDAEKNTGKYQFYDENYLPEIYTYERTATYEPRPNQKTTIEKFCKAVKKGRKKLLMYAVMRFGKSFTSMCCAVEMNANLVVVVSAKADVKEEWKKTVESHVKFKDYTFATSDELKSNKQFISNTLNNKQKVVLFLTLQDLQGVELKSKHADLFNTKIDLLLVDESHFGARASEYGRVLRDNFKLSSKQIKDEFQKEANIDDLEENIKVLNAHITMHLSGTPYRILMSDEFTDDDIVAFYQFSDIADDKARWDKEHLDHDDTKEWDNPYYGFPQMVRFAFNPSQSVLKKLETLKKEGFSYAMSELLRPLSISKDEENKHKKFVHEAEVLDLFQVIDGRKDDENVLGFLDFDRIKQGQMCRHIVCVLPFRASCDALENLITDKKKDFKNLGDYQIVNIAGLEADKTYKTPQDVKRKITECENNGQKTITLTVNRMLTGSTVEQWDTMIYLKETESPQEYDQAIFRLQNQYIKVYGEGNDAIKFNMKPQTLLVDFDINRVFRMQEQKSQIYNVNTDRNGNSELTTRIQKELEISPIIVVNKNRLQKVEPINILDAVREYSRTKSVADEAADIPTDFSLLDNENIRAVIENLNPIDAKQGIEIKPHGNDDDIVVPDTNDTKEKQSNSGSLTAKKELTNDEINQLKKKLATYYAQILFYAFLTESKVSSLTDIITDIDKNADHKRICKNVGLSKNILMLTQKYSNPFILSKLDYKIQNINTLIADKNLKPIERVEAAMCKFGRLGSSEIVTPAHVADAMVALLPQKDITEKSKILDIASKQGEFTCALYRRFGDKVKENIYAISTSSITYEFTRKVYALLGMPIKNVYSDFTSYDLLTDKKDTIIKKLKNMKFTAIVGNPPYQEMDGGHGGSSQTLYDKFITISKSINPNYLSMIMPSRWMTGGKGLDNFRKEMLEDRKIKILHDFMEASSLFTNVSIEGGICYFLREPSNAGKCLVTTHKSDGSISIEKKFLNNGGTDIVIRDEVATRILSAVRTKKEKTFDTIVSNRNPFNISGNKVSELITSQKTQIRILARYENQRQILNLKGSVSLTKNANWIDKFKLFVSKADGAAGQIGNPIPARIIGLPELGDKNVVCTETFLMVGPFDTKEEQENVAKYMKTKFFRFIVGIRKNKNMTSDTYSFVPLQDFTSSSDIDWSQSVAAIDQQLYAKYNLSADEIAFIEKMIKPME